MAGASLKEIKASPFVEKLLSRGYEVIYMDEPVDEYTLQSMPEFEKHRFQNAAKDNLKFGDEDETEKKTLEEMTENMKPLSEWLQKTLSDSVEKVVISNRLTTSPCAIVANSFGWSGNMQKIMKAHSNNKEDPLASFFGSQKRFWKSILPILSLKLCLNVLKEKKLTNQQNLWPKFSIKPL